MDTPATANASVTPPDVVTTRDPAGLRPVSLASGAALCESGCVPAIRRRPLRSRSNYRSGVVPMQPEATERDFVTNVSEPSGTGSRVVGFFH